MLINEVSETSFRRWFSGDTGMLNHWGGKTYPHKFLSLRQCSLVFSNVPSNPSFPRAGTQEEGHARAVLRRTGLSGVQIQTHDVPMATHLCVSQPGYSSVARHLRRPGMYGGVEGRGRRYSVWCLLCAHLLKVLGLTHHLCPTFGRYDRFSSLLISLSEKESSYLLY